MKNLQRLTVLFLAMATSDIFFGEIATAGGLFRSVGKEPTTPVDKPTPVPTVVPAPPVADIPASKIETPISQNDPALESYDIFSEVATPIMDEIDDMYSSYRELGKHRPGEEEDSLDSCDPVLENKDTFADRITYFIYQHSRPRRPHVDIIASYYGISNKRSTHTQVSLTKHAMCPVSRTTLTATLKGANRVPSQGVIDKMNTWIDNYNSLRARALAGDTEAEVGLLGKWSKFMGCLAYQESLSTADSAKSYSVAKKYAPTNYRKPAGVKFYEDPYQNEASRLNIGLFQFTPTASGNIGACIRHWNELYPGASCQISTRSSRSQLIENFGSSFQSMNAFCGVNKILQSFAIQVNTKKSVSTHPSNKTGASFKDPSNRCVSPFFYSGYSYNHFGPLMNSTGSNLGALMNCALR